MPDMEKVIRALEVCSGIGDYTYCPQECPYMQPGHICYGTNGLMQDALALLREREPVQFKVTQQRRSYPFWDAECDGCGYKTSTVHRNWKYCPECGRRIAWPD